VLVAVAGSQAWATAGGSSRDAANVSATAGAGQMPLGTTLALVVLAAWGVVLVTRGGVRRAAMALGAVGSLGVLATVVSGWWLVPDTLRAAARDMGGGQVVVDVTAWFWVALVAAVVGAAATVIAAFRVGGWPEMGTRYDAPTADPAATSGDSSPLELWKALDQGRDPTA
ncbi:MAG: Trp biosynthesis-associated membrane protein, partial [Nocardioides sp.]